jgi:dTDP-4-dehydrorhamnose reductase
MKALVFGRTGQVATELQRFGNTIAFGREEADLMNPEKCAEIVLNSGADVIINAAAYTAVDKAEEEEEIATIVNGAAPTKMAQAAAEIGKPFVHISTDYVFDGAGDTPWFTSDEANPLSAYGRSKRVGEEGVIAAGGTFAILRTSWVFSAHGKNFVKTMLQLSETREKLTIVDDQFGGPTAAADIARACLLIAQNLLINADLKGIYHFSGKPDVSWADFAQEIFTLCDRNVDIVGIPTIEYPTPATRPENSRMNCDGLVQNFDIARPDWRLSLLDVLKELGAMKNETT